MTNLILVAPLDGWSSALEEVPDPVFAGKVMGDGLAIDPTSATLCAPCAGEVIVLHAARHAVMLRAPNGAEILLHVGVDTVVLDGEGFEAHVAQGQRVRPGDPLLSFDLDGLASRVRSLMTPVIVVDGGRFEVVRREQRQPLKVGDFLMELQSLGKTTRVSTGGPEIRKSLRVPYEHGVHARPAALLAGTLRSFSADVSALAHGRTANARSAVAWMELGTRRGDEITLIAAGPDAGAALAALEAAFAADVPRSATVPRSSSEQMAEELRGTPRNSPADGLLRGVVASRGIAVGPAALIAGAVPLPNESGTGVARESADLERARGVVRTHLERLRAT
ncbi:MAG TPA: glucose PTS transporter subunit IIA, partial [Thermoanaerobaculia bacterium]|nr:glucose PTS transporter subunit IIA [Thermoanaerobaculia bacterium]